MRPSLLVVVLFVGSTAAAPPAATDFYGDPLPPGAVQRFGKTWFAGAFDYSTANPDDRSIFLLRNGIHRLRFDRQTGKLLETVTLPTEPAGQFAYSADGRRAILLYDTQWAPNRWEVWDIDRRKLTNTIRPKIKPAAWTVNASPDCRHIVAICDGSSPDDNQKFWVHVWDADTGKETGHGEVEVPVTTRQGTWCGPPYFSDDGRFFVRPCGSQHHSVLIAFDLTARVVWQKDCGPNDNSIPLDLGDRLLLPAPGSARAIRWADGVETTIRLPARLGPSDPVGCLRDGKTLLYRAVAWASGRAEVRAWDLERGTADPDFRPVPLKSREYANLTGSGRDHLVIRGDAPRLLDLETRRPVGPHGSVIGHRRAVRHIAFSADGKRLVTGDEDNWVKLWDTANGRIVGQWNATVSPVQWDYSGGGGGFGTCGPSAFAFSADGRRLALAVIDDDNRVRLALIDTATGRTRATRLLPELVNKNLVTVGRLAFDRGTDRVLAAFGDFQGDNGSPPGEPNHTLVRWDAASDGWTVLGELPMSAANRGTAAGDRWLIHGRFFDARTGRQAVELIGAARWGFALSADGRLAAGLGRTAGLSDFDNCDPVGDLRVWDARTGEPLVHLTNPPLPALPLVENPAAAAGVGADLVEDPRTRLRAAAVWPRTLALHPSGRWLATADVRGVRLWDLVTGRVVHTFPLPFRVPLEAMYQGSPATALTFSDDGTRLATGTPDGSVLVWSVPTPKAEPLSAKEAAALGLDLVGPDGTKAWRAAWRLLDDPAAAVRVVRTHLKPAGSIPAADVAKLLADADAPDFRRREAATRRLAEIIDQITPAVAEAEKSPQTSPEERERLRKLLATIPGEGPLSPSAAGQSRAIAVLEHVRTPEAEAALRELAGGATGAWRTREAQAALERLRGRARSISD